MEVPRHTITSFIVNQQVFDDCEGGETKRGFSPHQFWWKQTLDLEEARASATAEANVVSEDEGKEFTNP